MNKSKSIPKKRTLRTAVLGVIIVLALTMIVGVGGELFLRSKVTGCLAGAFSEVTGAPTKVSLSDGPLTFTWLAGKVAGVQIDTDDGAAESAMRLHARASGVRRDGSSVEHPQGDVYVPYSRIVAVADAETDDVTDKAVTIRKIRGSAASGTITIDSVHSLGLLTVPATIVLQPAVTDGRVDFHVQDVTVLGVGLGTDIGQQMVDRMSEAALGALSDEIEVHDLKIEEEGFSFEFSGDDVNIDDAEAGTNASHGARNCA